LAFDIVTFTFTIWKYATVILIDYSKILSYIGLVIVLGFAALSALKLRRELKEMKRIRRRSKNLNISKSQLLKEKNTYYYNNNEGKNI
jgi:hypothetical protein